MAAQKQQIAAAEAGVAGNGLGELPSLANQGKNHKQKKIGRLRRILPTVYLRKRVLDPLPTTAYKAHTKISDSRRNSYDLTAWLSKFSDDPVFEVMWRVACIFMITENFDSSLKSLGILISAAGAPHRLIDRMHA
jgi:hypothetical protein